MSRTSEQRESIALLFSLRACNEIIFAEAGFL